MPETQVDDPVAQEAAQLFAQTEGYEGAPAGDADGGEAQGTGEETQPAGTEGTTTDTKPVVDWESEENPYRQRFTGLQGNFKQVTTERQAMMQRMAQVEEELEIQRAVASGASDDEVNAIRKNWQDQGQIAEFVGNLAQENARIEHMRLALAPVAKQEVLRRIGLQYGVDPAEIAEAESPQAAEAIAKVLQKQGKTKVLHERKEKGVDRAESGGGGNLNLSKLSPLEKIRLGVAQASRR